MKTITILGMGKNYRDYKDIYGAVVREFTIKPTKEHAKKIGR